MQTERRNVRNALLRLMEDPPLRLGRGILARDLPGDALARGLLLKAALHQAIMQLRPQGEIDPANRYWWPYLIYRGEYEEGQPRAAIREALAISDPTYVLAKMQGLDRIVGALPHLLAGQATDERTMLLDRLLGGNVVGAMDRLRVAVGRYAKNPHSPKRQETLMRALEDVMAEQVNHLYSICGTLVVGPIERMDGQIKEHQRVIEGLLPSRAVGD